MTQRELFLAREDEVRRFSEALSMVRDEPTDAGWPAIMLVHGLGGIGKSTLLRHLRTKTGDRDAIAWLDFEDERRDHQAAFGGDAGPGLTTVLDAIMRSCIDAMELRGDLAAAKQVFDDYRSGVARLPTVLEQIRAATADVERTGLAKEDIVALEKSAVAVAALVAQQPVGVAAAAGAMSAVGQAVLSKPAFWRKLTGAPRVAPDDYDLVSDPQRALARRFGRCVSALSGYRPLVVFLDTSEIVLAQMPWLREMMHASGGRILWVIGVRLEPESGADADSDIAAFVRQVPSSSLRLMTLTRFDDETVRRYLNSRVPGLVLDDDDVTKVSGFTKGLPLAVSLVADLLAKGETLEVACAEVDRPKDSFAPVTPGQVVSALARRFLMHTERLTDPKAKQDLHRILCLAIANGYPSRNPEVLKALWDSDEDLFEACSDLERRHDFVLSGSFRMHDDVREALRADLMNPLCHPRIEDACRRATDVLGCRLAELRTYLPTLQSQLESEKYLATLLDYVWYSFWAQPESGWRAALTVLPILAVTDESAADFLLATIEWFVGWGGESERGLFAALAAPMKLSFLDQWLAKRKGQSAPLGALGVNITGEGLRRLSTINPVDGILGALEDRRSALSLIDLRLAISESRVSAADAVSQLIELGSGSDPAFSPSAAEALADIADAIRKDSSNNTPENDFLLAVEALSAADGITKQPAWRLGGLALDLASRSHGAAPVEDGAEEMYKRAIAADPNHANTLGNYAVFLKNVRGDHDGAEEMYKRAIAADPKHANNLGNYANLLTDVRGDHDGAEEMYKRAIAADPKHANNLGNYAYFLTSVRGDHDRAVKIYEQAIAADPKDANNLGNCARLLFIRGQDDEAERLARRALELSTDAEIPLRAECFFYLFMHVAGQRTDAGSKLKALLAKGVSTDDWDFSQNLDRLSREGDPRHTMLVAVAEALRKGEAEGLDRFEEWRALSDL